MTAREWKPGDVAIVDGPGQRLPITFYKNDESPELMFNNGCGYQHPARHLASTARPLVVIDPEDDSAIARLENILEDHGCRIGVALQAALREFATPTPPKPAEPTGLGAVVEDRPRPGRDQGELWIRVYRDGGSAKWHRSGAGEPYAVWSAIDAVRVLFEGVTQ